MDAKEIVITKPTSEADYEAAARLMSENEPWKTFGRTYEYSLKKAHNTEDELYMVKEGDQVLGCALLQMHGQLKGFIRSIVVDKSARNRGIGSKLLDFIEKRVFKDTDNVFLFVSSFNGDAKRLYLKLGYQEIGPFKDYIVPGYDEILLRKTKPK